MLLILHSNRRALWIVAHIANFVISSFEDNDERNPFTIFEPGSPEFKQEIEKTEYKGVFIRNLSAQMQQEPNRSKEALFQSILDTISWRHALMHTAANEAAFEFVRQQLPECPNIVLTLFSGLTTVAGCTNCRFCRYTDGSVHYSLVQRLGLSSRLWQKVAS